MNYVNFLLNDVVSSFLRWIAATSFMATVMAILILFIRQLLKNHLPVKWQYLMWFLLMIRMVIPWAPESHFSLYNAFTFHAEQHPEALFIDMKQKSVVPATDVGDEVPSSDSSKLSSIAQDDVDKSPATVLPWKKIALILGWLIGAITLICYLVRVNLKCSREMKKYAYIVSDPVLVGVLEQCKSELTVRRKVPLIMTNGVDGPALYGVIHPKILIPAGIEDLHPNELRFIFLHELVHYKRKDILANWLMTCLLVIQWFNPILWYAYRKMREDQELSCDAATISRLSENEIKEYGNTIIKLLKKSSSKAARLLTSTNFSMGKSQLMRRITMITYFKKKSSKWSAAGLALLVLLVAVSLTNAKNARADDFSSTLAAELDAMEKNNAPLLAKLDSQLRIQVEKTIRQVMRDLGQALPLESIEAVPKEHQWLLKFTGDGTGFANLWVDDQTGEMEVVKFGLDLSPDRVDPSLVDQAGQSLKEAGFDGNSKFKIHRNIELDPTLNFPYEVQTKFQDGESEVLFSNGHLTRLFIPLSPDEVTENQNQFAKQALSVIRKGAGDQLIKAYHLISGRKKYLTLEYMDGSHVYFDSETNEISQIGVPSLSDHMPSSMKPEQLIQTAAPIVSKLFKIDLNEYSLTFNKKAPGTGTFSKPGELYINFSYNNLGIYLITRTNVNFSK